MDTQAFLQKHDQIMFAVLVVMLTVALLRFGYAGASKRVYVRKPEHRIAFDAPSRNIAFATFRGIPQNPSFRIDELEQLVTTFPTRDGDVFICTYPKCGTTWMQQICHLLVHGGEQGSTTMYATAPWLERKAEPRPRDLVHIDVVPEPESFRDVSFAGPPSQYVDAGTLLV